MLYPLQAEDQLFRLKYPEGYRHRDMLRRLTEEVHTRLQRTHTESEEWFLVVLMDQVTSEDPAWGSLSHQISVLRKFVLTPLRENYSQEPAFTIGLLPDYWERKTGPQIPTTPEHFLQWSLDRYGLLRVQTLEVPTPVSIETSEQYEYLFHESDKPRIADGSESEIRNLFDSKINAIPRSREMDGDVLPPTQNPDLLRSIRDQILEDFQDGTPWSTCQRLVRKHFSALGETIQEQLNDLALLRMPMGREPLPRRKRDLIHLDYVQGIFPLLPGIDLQEHLADTNDKIRAYWLGTRETTDRVSSIEIATSNLYGSAQRYEAHLQEERTSLDQAEVGSFRLELFEPFDHDCELTFSEDWKPTVHRLNSFPFVRRAASSSRWLPWAEDVEEVISKKYAHLSSELSDCLTEARQQWDDHPTRTEEGQEISPLVTQLENTAETKRQGVLDRSSEGFSNDWSDRAESLASSVQNALKLRPTRQQLPWSLGAVFLLSILLLIPSSNLATSRMSSLVFLVVTGLLLGLLGFYLARRHLISCIKEETNRATREAENVIDELHQFVRNREEAIENYFEALIAKKNLERAREKQEEIESRRFYHHFHQRTLSEHLDEANALSNFLPYSETENEELPSDTIEQLDRPPHISPVYWLTRSDPTTIQAFTEEIETNLLSGLEEITAKADPALTKELVSSPD